MKSIQLVYSIIFFSFSCLLLSCESAENGADMASVRVLLVDAPADYDSVVIMIEDVQINLQDGDAGWTSLSNFQAAKYDLLKLTAGNQAFLGEIELPEGHLKQLRLILGEENTLYQNGESFELKTPSAQQSGLKLNLDVIISAGVTYEIIVDFDAGKSIVKAGNSGNFNLKPVLRAQSNALTGAIKGILVPKEIKSILYSIKDLDTASTYPNDEGEFLFPSLEPGIYEVLAVPEENTNYLPIRSEEIIVSVGRISDLGEFELAKL